MNKDEMHDLDINTARGILDTIAERFNKPNMFDNEIGFDLEDEIIKSLHYYLNKINPIIEEEEEEFSCLHNFEDDICTTCGYVA